MNGRLRRLPIDNVYRPILMIIGLVLFGIISVSPVAAQTPVGVQTADFTDWDLPMFQGAGQCPSAIGAVIVPPSSKDPVYYVTRCDDTSVNNPTRVGPTLVRFAPGMPMNTAPATWSAFWLAGTSQV